MKNKKIFKCSKCGKMKEKKDVFKHSGGYYDHFKYSCFSYIKCIKKIDK